MGKDSREEIDASLIEVITWASKAGIEVTFTGVRMKDGGFFYKAQLRSYIGSKVKQIDLMEANLRHVLGQIKKRHRELFTDLFCPAMPLRNAKDRDFAETE